MEKFEGFGDAPEIVKHPQALERANLVVDQNRIDAQSFVDLYGEDNVEKDRLYVEKREAQFHANDFRDIETRVAKERATIFEAIICQEGDQAMWFGENSAIITPSLYDDIKNGVDAAIEIEMEDAVATTALSIDVTFRRDIGSKLRKISSKIAEGRLAKMKYYESQLEDFRGEKRNVPHFVIGANAKTVAELTNLFAERKSAQFADHPIQFQIIESIIIQADKFAEIAIKDGKDNIARIYQRIGRIFRKIKSKRDEEVGDSGKRDSFFENLKTDLENLS